MYINHLTKFFNSTLIKSKIYDYVCIGPYACIVGKRIYKKLQSQKLKSYYANDCIEQLQPSLIATHHNYQSNLQQPFIQKVNTLIDYPLNSQKGSGVKIILPEQSKIVMHNGQIIQYKQLIYSGNHADWKNSNIYQNLSEAVSTPFTSVYGDGSYHCRNFRELYHRNNSSSNGGDIIFAIPSGDHFGYQNYFMMHLYDSLKKWADTLKNRKSFKITILLENDKFFPAATQHDAYIKKILKEDFPDISVINNCKIQNLNFKQRKVVINGAITPYQALFQYMPLKIPSLLEKAKINPFNINKQSLRHNEYQNISIVGNNIKESTYSFYSLNYRINNIVENICSSLIGSRVISVYEGNSFLPLWINRKEVTYLLMNYKKAQNPQNLFLSKNKIIRKILARDRMLFSKKQIQYFMKGTSYGFPYYLTTPKSKTINEDQDSYVPNIIRKTI